VIYNLAKRFVGQISELDKTDHPFIQWCFTLCNYGPDTPDETPWCSAFLNGLAWIFDLPRSGSAAARSWLGVGIPIAVAEAVPGDVVILKQADSDPGPDVKNFRGHVALFSYVTGDYVGVIGGNQSDSVTLAQFPLRRILGIRRIQGT
jgi:uncharacterized protein (TIGR02594 family)